MSEKKQQTAYPLRMPTGLREKLEESAAKAKRSLNAEIVARLDASYDYIPESRAISAEEGVTELNELYTQQATLLHLQMAKIRALVDLKAELNDLPSTEEKGALLAAASVAQSEIDSLSLQRHETMKKYEALQAQIKLNAKTPRKT